MSSSSVQETRPSQSQKALALWTGLIGLLFALYSLSYRLFSPVTLDLFDLGPLHLVHVFISVAIILLVPGLPISRLLLSGREASPTQVLAFSVAINILFYAAVIVALRYLGIVVSAYSLLLPAAAFCLLALILMGLLRTLKKPLIRRNIFYRELAIGLGFMALFTLFYSGELLRPSFRIFCRVEGVHEFANHTPLPVARLEFAQGFTKLDNGLWEMTGPTGTLRIVSETAQGTFPLRWVVYFHNSITSTLHIEGREPLLIQAGQKGCEPVLTDTYPALPPYSNNMVALDLPLSKAETLLRIESSGPLPRRVRIEDYSNLGFDRAMAHFFERNAFQMKFDLNDFFGAADRIEQVLNIQYQPPFGFTMHDLAFRLGGRNVISLNALFLGMILVCFLVSAEILHVFRPVGNEPVWVFPALVSWGCLVEGFTVSRNTFLVDHYYTAFLLIAMLLLAAQYRGPFIAASLPASLVRFPGIVLLGVYQLIRMIGLATHRQSLRIFGSFLFFWFLVLSAATLMVVLGGDWQTQLSHLYFETFPEHFRDSTQTFTLGQWLSLLLGRPLRFFGLLVGYSSGFALFLLLPQKPYGWHFLLLTAFYSSTLMYITHANHNYFYPLVYFACIGAGWNLLSVRERWKRPLFWTSIGLAVLFLL